MASKPPVTVKPLLAVSATRGNLTRDPSKNYFGGGGGGSNFDELNKLLKPSLPQFPNETHVLNKQRLDEFNHDRDFRDRRTQKDTTQVAKLRTQCQRKMEKLYQETLRTRRMILRVFTRTQTIPMDLVQRTEALKENLYATLQAAAELEVSESFYVSSMTLPPLLQFDVPAWLQFINTPQTTAQERKQMESALRAVLKTHVLPDLPLPMTVAPIVDMTPTQRLANPFQRLAAKVARRPSRAATPRQELSRDEQIMQWLTAYRPQEDPRMQKRELVITNATAHHMFDPTAVSSATSNPMVTARSTAETLLNMDMGIDLSHGIPPNTARRRPNGSVALPAQAFHRSSQYTLEPAGPVAGGSAAAPPVPPMSASTNEYLAAILAATISTTTAAPASHSNNKNASPTHKQQQQQHHTPIPGLVPGFVFGGGCGDGVDSSRAGPLSTGRKGEDDSIWLQEKDPHHHREGSFEVAGWSPADVSHTSALASARQNKGKHPTHTPPPPPSARRCQPSSVSPNPNPNASHNTSSSSAMPSARGPKKPIIAVAPAQGTAPVPRPGTAFQPLKPKAIGIPSFWGTDYSNEAAAPMESVRATPHRGNSIFSWVRGRMRRSQSVVQIDPNSGRVRAPSFSPEPDPSVIVNPT